MRRYAHGLTVLMLAGCSLTNPAPAPVDPAHLPPFTGQEQALLISAEAADAQGNARAAEKDYLSAVGASTGHIEAHLALANLYLRTGQPEKVAELLERAAVFQPNHAGIRYLQGKAALAQHRYPEALAYFNQGLALAPGEVDLSSGAGIAQDMMGRHREAQAVYEQAISAHKGGNLTALKTNLGISYLFSNEPKRTIVLLKPEVKKPEATATTRANLALAYGLVGETLNAQFTLKGEGSEADRKAALARLKRYIADQRAGKTPQLPVSNADDTAAHAF